MFRKLLIANRGEIAVRVMRACRELGIATVAVYSEADRNALHVRLADEAYPCGAAAARESYLAGERILAIARRCGAEAIHPGYGLLSENGDFSDACARAGISFVGPSGDVIRAMGDKVTSRRTAEAAGIPIVPGATAALSDDEATAYAREIGFPVMVKASAGGGGRGLRLVREASELAAALERARSEAATAFGDAALYVEKLVERPRHIEIQLLADSFGAIVHLGERECSIQRRHQKLIEEAPAHGMTPELRAQMGAAAIAMARAVGYVGAGTCEFLLDPAGHFYFLEMNTRIQVEHAISEEVTGIDIVKAMIGIAAGERLPWTQAEVELHGHAIEARIYAEDPDRKFLPSPGTITGYRPPDGIGVRVDSGVQAGTVVSVHYDAMLAKLVVWGEDRDEAVARLGRALHEFSVRGIRTSIAFHLRAVEHAVFRAGAYDTGFVDDLLREASPAVSPAEARAQRAACVLAAVALHRRDAGDAREGRYRVTATGGASVAVSLRAGESGHWSARFDGDEAEVDLATGAGSADSLIVDGAQFEGFADARKKDRFEVAIGGRVYRFEAVAAG